MSALKRPCILVNKETKEKFPCNFVINQPQPKDDGANYSCICEITGAPDIYHEVFGFDPIQAIELSMWHMQVHFADLLNDYDILYPEGGKMDFFITPNAPLWPNT